ncbi:zf-HC2 domain-containing protein [Pseudoduganella dura]|nr:zf-HC2 domain-containing protein [Pseudoduganella dura]GGX89365.1 hypothetical protein GCM10007386_20260 [Pseudoduganella dura]
MNAHDTQQHATAWPLLPWHAAGRLEGADEALVAEHLRTCEACRAELAWQRQLHVAADSAGHAAPMPDVDAAFARLLPRLDDGAAPAGRREKAAGALAALMAWLGRMPTLPAALAAALVVLAVALPSAQPPYLGLGPVPAAAGNATVVFRPDTGAGDVRRILAAAGAQAVHGPTVAGAYVLEIGVARRDEALARLRAEPAVLMAEPLDAGEAP